MPMNHAAIAILSRKTAEGDTEYLFMRSAKPMGAFTGFWYPPGGAVEEDESVESCLHRELQEELGVKINLVREIAVTEADAPDYTLHWWEATSEEIAQASPQEAVIIEIKWMTKEELLSQTNVWPATRKFITTL